MQIADQMRPWQNTEREGASKSFPLRSTGSCSFEKPPLKECGAPLQVVSRVERSNKKDKPGAVVMQSRRQKCA
jgi:hypothetical protein